MITEETNVDYIKSEQDDYYSDDDLYNINSWGADLSFRELILRYKEGDLLKPEMQRKYVWDKSEASRFIDSILLGLPVPSIFLAKTQEENLLIVDGYQRIMTVHDYVEGIFSKDGKVFKLTKTDKINPRWQGKAFKELADTEQKRINNTTIHAIIFVQLKPSDDDTSMYQVFERINTSGRTLFPQEIRNCIYQGRFNELLIDLNNNTSWRQLYGLNAPDSRMRDIEFILRFLALSSNEFLKIKTKAISLKKFLNTFMGSKDSNDPNVLDNRKKKFCNTIDFIHKNIGPQSFHNLSKEYANKLVPKFNPTIFDSISIATSEIINQKHINVKELEKKRLRLLKNEKYQELISIRTTNIDNIKTRISLAKKYLYGV